VNGAVFDYLMTTFKDRKQLGQDPKEWRYFLEFIWSFFHSRGIEHPLVVEIGIWNGLQRRFYEKLLEAEYIGIDNLKPFAPISVNEPCATPDIIGDSHEGGTVEKLKARLAGRKIDLLFIDGDHSYESVRYDFELYEPMTKYFIAFHDCVGTPGPTRFWTELVNGNKQNAFVLFKKDSSADWRLQMGIGVMVKTD